jgi:Uma2 family endonuclease
LQEYQLTPTTRLPQQLVYGAIRVADAPIVSHQRAVFAIARAWQEHVASRRLGEVLIAPTDVILDADRALVLQPDALFVSRHRAEIVRERVYGAPDLVLEVLSPEPRIGQIHERISWFASHGVREIWLHHQSLRRTEVLACADRVVVRRASFDLDVPVRSEVLPEFGHRMSVVLEG